jgi:hypothetical protein
MSQTKWSLAAQLARRGSSAGIPKDKDRRGSVDASQFNATRRGSVDASQSNPNRRGSVDVPGNIKAIAKLPRRMSLSDVASSLIRKPSPFTRIAESEMSRENTDSAPADTAL